ncbi:MAG TPA: hypothetical protein VE991_11945, partial [Acidimicrobiales bacterium]|nr:hypothetical protein [Acidimicrobiales bacterium]
KFGTGALTTPSGYLSFVFIVFVLAASYFACSQVGAAREEEAQQRLETVLAQPVGRGRWLLGRLVVAGGGVASLSVLTGLCTWAGAASQGVAVSLPGMLLAGANCAPTAVLFLGLAALAYAVVPRAASAVSYGLVSVAFLWYVVGSLFRLPAWVVDLTPYRHIGLVPAQPFDTVSAVGMGVVGVVAASAALAVFRRRDLLSA